MVNTQAPKQTSRWPAFDLMRGVAITGVVLVHFFVVSGFLLTYLFFQQRESWNLKLFYKKRAARILPPLFTLLAVSGAAYALLTPSMPRLTLASPWLVFTAAATSWLNLLRSSGADAGFLAHVWSLSLEEQFYLTLGISFALLRKRPAAILALSCVAYVAFLTEYFAPAAFSAMGLGLFTINRAHNLFLGVITALLSRRAYRSRLAPPLFRSPAGNRAALAAVLAVFVLLFQGLPTGTPISVEFILIGFVSAAATALLLREGGAGFRLLQAIGRRSYSIYLWHWPIQCLLAATELPKLGKGALYLPLTAAFAEISYRFVEPFFVKRLPAPKADSPQR
jgi:peptidoglycan/LPS O-acetylase OafA/YrhL